MSEPEGADRPSAEEGPRPLLGFGFWLTLAISLLCVLAGVAVAVLGPRL